MTVMDDYTITQIRTNTHLYIRGSDSVLVKSKPVRIPHYIWIILVIQNDNDNE